MDTQYFYQDIVKRFVYFCALSGCLLELGLSAEQLLCLFHECLELARKYHDRKLCFMICTVVAVRKTKELRKTDDILGYAKEFLVNEEKMRSLLEKEMLPCLELGETYCRLNKPNLAITYLKRAAALSKQRGAKEIEIQANFRLQETYNLLNQHENAIPSIVRLIEIAEEAKDNRRLVVAYMALVKTYYELRQYDQSLKYGKKCINIANEIKYDHEGLSMVYVLLIDSFLKLKQPDQVIVYAKKYIHDFSQKIEAHPKSIQEGNFVFILSDLLPNRPEQYDDAYIDGSKCYKILVKDTKYILCWMFFDIGLSYLQLRNEENVLFYCNQVIKMVKQDKECDPLDSLLETLTFALRIAGQEHYLSSQYATALNYFNKSLEMAEELGNSTAIWAISYDISYLNRQVGIDNSAYCSSLYEFITTTGYPPDEPTCQLIKLYEAAKNCCDNREYEGALSYCELIKSFQRSKLGNSFIFLFQPPQLVNKVLINLEMKINLQIAMIKMLRKDFDTALSLSQEILEKTQKEGHKLEIHVECHLMIGLIHFLQGNFRDAEISCRKSIECLENMFDLLHRNEEYQIAIVHKYYTLCYELLTIIQLLTLRNNEALETTDRYRARALKRRLIMKYHTDYDTQEQPLRISDIQPLVVNNNYTIVLYLSLKAYFKDTLCTFVVPCENEKKLVGVRIQSYSNFDVLEKDIGRAFSEMKVREIHCEDRSLDNDTETVELKENRESDSRDDTMDSALEILYRKLIQNVISDIDTDEIVFIPDGLLFKVPFAALRDPDTKLYLSETKRMRIAPSISTLTFLNDHPAEFEFQNDALVIGDPSVGDVIYNGQRMNIRPLLFAYVEALQISEIVGGTTLLRDNATKAAVLEKLQQGVSVVHIAAHGVAVKGIIALAPSPNASKIPAEDDYMLTMSDVQQANVRAKLVVLSCCHSGRGEIKAEGVIGMCRAFLASGARAVVASLWAIDDEATLKFMKEFYRNLKEKKSASLSLQLAMKFMMKTKEFNEPKYWAPFFLMGEDVTIF